MHDEEPDAGKATCPVLRGTGRQRCSSEPEAPRLLDGDLEMVARQAGERPARVRISQPPCILVEAELGSNGVTRNPPRNRKGEERKLYP